MRYSNKAIIILEDKFLQNRIETILAGHNITISAIPEFSKIDSLRLRLRQDGNFEFLPELLSETAKKDAPPIITIMQYHNTMYETEHEDRSELFSTMILSFMLLSSIREFESIHAGFLLPYRHYDHDHIKKIKDNPDSILSKIKPVSETTSRVLEKFKSNPGRFSSLFTLNFMETEGNTEQVNTRIKLYVKSIEKRISFENKKEIKSGPAIQKNESVTCDVFYKKTGIRPLLIVNGELSDDYAKFADSPDDQLCVTGNWGSSNLLDVNDKIILTVSYLLENRITTYKDELKLYLRNDCRIDGSIAVSSANLLNRLFGRFSGAYLCVTGPNEKILSSSPGYSLLKTHIKRIN